MAIEINTDGRIPVYSAFMAILFSIFAIDYGAYVLVSMAARTYHAIKKKIYKACPKCGYDEDYLEPGKEPRVLIQLPMYNEETYAETIIQKCCAIDWPKDKLCIQVLDDSTKPHIRELVDAAVLKAVEMGYPVTRLRRENRQGFKAGAMKEALELIHGQYEYVAIFDADFTPPIDFLYRTVPRMVTDAGIGFVQTRWVFESAGSLLMWVQKVSLDFHFVAEQQARSFTGGFFNYNGTAGVWRISCIEDAGGWEADTVVEDADLSLRAYLKGWRFLYLHDVECLNELPSTWKAYKTQQFRWLAGPMQIVRKALTLIIKNKTLPFWRLASCYWHFIRYVLFAILTMNSLFVTPLIMIVEPFEAHFMQYWFIIASVAACFILLYVTWFTPLYLLLSVAFGYYKAYAMLIGIMNGGHSWVVTVKANKFAQFKKQTEKKTCITLVSDFIIMIKDYILGLLVNFMTIDGVVTIYNMGLALYAFAIGENVFGTFLFIGCGFLMLCVLGDQGPLVIEWDDLYAEYKEWMFGRKPLGNTPSQIDLLGGDIDGSDDFLSDKKMETMKIAMSSSSTDRPASTAAYALSRSGSNSLTNGYSSSFNIKSSSEMEIRSQLAPTMDDDIIVDNIYLDTKELSHAGHINYTRSHIIPRSSSNYSSPQSIQRAASKESNPSLRARNKQSPGSLLPDITASTSEDYF